jgi:hypothetical protein
MAPMLSDEMRQRISQNQHRFDNQGCDTEKGTVTHYNYKQLFVRFEVQSHMQSTVAVILDEDRLFIRLASQKLAPEKNWLSTFAAMEESIGQMQRSRQTIQPFQN